MTVGNQQFIRLSLLL